MAGLPAAICAAQRGAHVLLIEATDKAGGKLAQSSGQISAAGTRLQKQLGIDDSPDEHFDEVMRISEYTADPAIVRLCVDNAADTIDWLMDIGVEMTPGHPVLNYFHDIYRVRRYYWPVDKGKTILAALIPLMNAEIARGTLDLRVRTEMTGLLREPGGAVTGVSVTSEGGASEDHLARNTVLAAGGYIADAELCAELSPGLTIYSPPMPLSTGKALRIARAAGCKVDGGDKYLCMLGGVLEDPANPQTVRFSLSTVPQWRPPWEIWVNAHGARFMREDHPSAGYRERTLQDQPAVKAFVVFDEGIRQNAPNITTHLTDNELRAAFGTHPSYLRGDTVAEDAPLDGPGKNMAKGRPCFRDIDTRPTPGHPAGVAIERLRVLELHPPPFTPAAISAAPGQSLVTAAAGLGRAMASVEPKDRRRFAVSGLARAPPSCPPTTRPPKRYIRPRGAPSATVGRNISCFATRPRTALESQRFIDQEYRDPVGDVFGLHYQQLRYPGPHARGRTHPRVFERQRHGSHAMDRVLQGWNDLVCQRRSKIGPKGGVKLVHFL